MLEKFMLKLVEAVLAWAANRAIQEANNVADKIARDKERGEINEENAKKYEGALTRAEQIRNATDLLNRVRSSP